MATDVISTAFDFIGNIFADLFRGGQSVPFVSPALANGPYGSGAGRGKASIGYNRQASHHYSPLAAIYSAGGL